MLLNTATDMVYIGQTTGPLKERISRHRDKRGRKNSRLRNALIEFPWHCWEVIVIERCRSPEELDSAEARWIEETYATNPNIGYNSQRTAKRATARLPRHSVEMTPEQREKFRVWGRKGAIRAAEKKMLSQDA